MFMRSRFFLLIGVNGGSGDSTSSTMRATSGNRPTVGSCVLQEKGARDGKSDPKAGAFGSIVISGRSDGAAEGTSDGTEDGKSDGIVEGTSDGIKDGLSDGTCDGTSDGGSDSCTATDKPPFVSTSDGLSSVARAWAPASAESRLSCVRTTGIVITQTTAARTTAARMSAVREVPYMMKFSLQMQRYRRR